MSETSFAPVSTTVPPHSEDITAAWMRCHPHLQPDVATVPRDANGLVALTVHLRFGGEHWAEMQKVHYEPTGKRFLFTAEARAELEQKWPAIAGLTVDAVNARLWSATPTLINIEPTTRCNLKCWYCVGRHMVQQDMDSSNFERMLNNFPGLKTIALVGEGEPLMHKDFFVMARQARDRGIKVMIISNGTAFSASVIQQLCEAEVAYVAISIDSVDPAQFASSRIEAELERVLSGIQKLRTYRDENGYQFPKIALKGTLFEATKTHLPQIVDVAKAHGVEIFESFQPLNPMHNYVRIYPKDKLGELPCIDRVVARSQEDVPYAHSQLQPFRQFCEENDIDFFPQVNPNPLRKNCDETWIYSLLSGDVTPCCQIKTPPSPNWNIFDRSIQSILHDPDYENTRFNLWNGFFPDYCTGCWKTR